MSGAILFSGFVALTLTPMMCSLLLKRSEGRLAEAIHGISHKVEARYGRALRSSMQRPWIAGVLSACVLVLTYLLWTLIPSELAPNEDRAGAQVQVQLPEGASFEETVAQMARVEKVLLPYVDSGEATRVMIRAPGSFGFTQDYNSGRSMVQLGPRSRTTTTTALPLSGLVTLSRVMQP